MPRVTVRLRDGSVETFEDWISGSGQRRITHRAEVDASRRLVVYRTLEVIAAHNMLVWETKSERIVAEYRGMDWFSFGEGIAPA